MPDLVYSAHTGSHPVLVTDEGDLRCLRFGTGERQSCIDRRTPWVLQLAYTRWMMTALLLPQNPQRLLLFGLGGGAMVHFLLHHLPEARLDVVEREGLVIDLARRFFARRGWRVDRAEDLLADGQVYEVFHMSFDPAEEGTRHA